MSYSAITNLEHVSFRIQDSVKHAVVSRSFGRGCGYFVSDFKPSSMKDNFLMLYGPADTFIVTEEMVEWYFKQILKFGIETEYLGVEKLDNTHNDMRVLVYHLTIDNTNWHRLLAYSIIRYAWSNPFVHVVRNTYNFLQRNPEFDFGSVFSIFTSICSNYSDYSSTYGIMKPGSRRLINSDEWRKLITENKSISYPSVHNLCASTGSVFSINAADLRRKSFEENHDKVIINILNLQDGEAK